MFKRLTSFILFGNHFYGICAVGLSIEASLQQFVPLNPFFYYLLVYAASVVYYTKAYINETTADTNNKRSVWYLSNKRMVFISQLFFTAVMALAVFILFKDSWRNLLHMSIAEWFLILVFPLTGAMYYGIIPIFSRYNLRNTGWMKPFVIGFVWAGFVTVYPLLFQSVRSGKTYHPTLVAFLLSLKNFMFVAVLCIMFDIKDYASDHNHQLKTFVVRVGLRKTIFYIIIPLCVIGLTTFIMYASIRLFPVMRIIINMIPFILLIIVAYSLHRRKTILYYLAIIDGLMLVKAICGSVGILLIK